MRVRNVPDPKAHWMRPTLPFSELGGPPPDLDSTRVLLMPSGKAIVVFARDASGRRPDQKFVASMAEADEAVRVYRLAKILAPLLAWLASFLPPRAKRPLAKTVADSGIRAKPISQPAKRGAR